MKGVLMCVGERNKISLSTLSIRGGHMTSRTICPVCAYPTGRNEEHAADRLVGHTHLTVASFHSSLHIISALTIDHRVSHRHDEDVHHTHLAGQYSVSSHIRCPSFSSQQCILLGHIGSFITLFQCPTSHLVANLRSAETDP